MRKNSVNFEVSPFECERQYIREYVENLLPSLGGSRLKVKSVEAASVQYAADWAANSQVQLYGNNKGVFNVQNPATLTDSSLLFVGSLTLCLEMRAATSGHAQAKIQNLLLPASTAITILDINAGASYDNRIFNIPFVTFTDVYVNANADLNSAVAIDVKFDGWLVNLM